MGAGVDSLLTKCLQQLKGVIASCVRICYGCLVVIVVWIFPPQCVVLSGALQQSSDLDAEKSEMSVEALLQWETFDRTQCVSPNLTSADPLLCIMKFIMLD